MVGISEQLSFADESDEYREFLAKFKPKKTTDDCYTPANVYDAVADWVAEEYGVDREAFVRPFWPGEDYTRYSYTEGCVVVDNPPFSIITPIVRWYETHGVRYFLFAPYLTNFNIPTTCHVIAGSKVTYENGAVVPTSFVTNLDEAKARSAPTLAERIKAADDENVKAAKRQLPKYIYPAEVLTASFLGRLSKYGIEFSVGPEECAPIGALDSQRAVGKAIFGHGYLLSERAAAERAAAERAAAERAAAARAAAERAAAELAAAEQAAAERWQLSERERQIVSMLGKGGE